jgi:hypothetical protein
MGADIARDIACGGGSVNPEHRTEDLTDDVSFEELVKELDTILDSWFMDEVAPALEEARLARAELDAA